MIRGVCTFRAPDATTSEQWPDVFAFPPRIGDWCKSYQGTRAKVVGVTHCVTNNAMVIGAPAIEVELRR